jgi:PAS domain S-box-containing protein
MRDIKEKNGDERLSDLVDTEALQNLVRRFAEFSGLPVALVERPGACVLASTRRRDICEFFQDHQVTALTRRREMAHESQSGQGAVIVFCPNGLAEGICPVLIEGRCVADLMAGPVLFEALDEKDFCEQAAERGLDEAVCMQTLRDVPVMSRERLEQAVELLAGLAEAVGGAGLNALRALRAEASLAKSEQQYRQLVAEAQTAILKIDPEGRVAFINEQGQKLFGYAEEDLLGRPALGLIIPERTLAGKDNRTDIDFFFESRAEGRSEGEGVRQDGGRIWCDWLFKPLYSPDGAFDGYLWLVSDVTERKMAEVQLYDAVTELTAIFQNSLVGVVFLRGGRYIAKINQRMADILGYEAEEMAGQPMERFHLSKEYSEEFGQKYYGLLATSELIHVEQPLRRKDGSVVWCLLSGKALEPENLDRGVIWVADDISERKELEKLKEDVEVMARHDLRTPLNSLVTIPQVILQADNLDSDQKRLLRLIRDSGYRMLDMINLSLVLFRMEQGAYRLEPENVDAASLVRRILDELGAMFDGKKVRVELELDGLAVNAPFIVQGEKLLLYSLLSNIIKNALEASPVGGVVKIGLHDDEEARLILVRNEGTIPEAIRGRVFEKYATHGKKGGAGLGAYSARLIARAHGGDILIQALPDATVVETILPKRSLKDCEPPLFLST